MAKKDDFEVKYPNAVTDTDDGVIIATDTQSDADLIKQMKKEFKTSAQDFEKNTKTYSRYLGGTERAVTDTLTLSEIDKYAENPQNNLADIKKINNIVKQYVNKNDIIGKVYESIESYTNTQYNLEYPVLEKDSEKKKLDNKVRPLITKFNEMIDLKSLIKLGTTTAFLEGNFVTYLRGGKEGKAVVDCYPISFVEVSEYNINGEPAILFNVSELKSKLRVNSRKKKNGKDIFFDEAEKIVKNNYPKEVYDAYKNNEKYALLDINRVGIVRVNNLGGLYGLTPIFKALKPALLLESIETADETIVKVRSKKIVHQKLRKEVAGADYEKQGFAELDYAHTNLLNAWKNKTVLVTTPWWVESINYVTCDDDLTDTDTLKTYRSRVFNSLGINFMDTEASLNLSNVSIKDLMKTIDKIAEDLSHIINKYYKVILKDNNIDTKLSPKLQIVSSEALSMEMKKSIAQFIYTNLGGSLDTCYNLIGISSAETEAVKRLKEKENGIEDALAPHANYYNQTAKPIDNDTDDNKGGRPQSKIENKKQQYDKTRNDSKVK